MVILGKMSVPSSWPYLESHDPPTQAAPLNKLKKSTYFARWMLILFFNPKALHIYIYSHIELSEIYHPAFYLKHQNKHKG